LTNVYRFYTLLIIRKQIKKDGIKMKKQIFSTVQCVSRLATVKELKKEKIEMPTKWLIELKEKSGYVFFGRQCIQYERKDGLSKKYYGEPIWIKK